jgi:hypothetical protein
MADAPGSSAGKLRKLASDGEHKTRIEFLSREEQLYFRTITTFLSWTDRWNVEADGIQPPTRKTRYKNSTKKRAFALLTSFANVLVRHKEVLAIVPSSLKTRTAQAVNIFIEPSNPANELSGCYLPTTNPERFVQNEHTLTQPN